MTAKQTEVLRTLLTFEAKGDKEVARVLQELADEASKSQKKTESAAGTVGSAFKAVSRDIDAVAGKSSATMAKWVSDALGVAEAFGQGGVMRAVAGVTLVLGLGAAAWTLWSDRAQEAGKVANAAAANVSTLLSAIRDRAAQGVAADPTDALGNSKESAEALFLKAEAQEKVVGQVRAELEARHGIIAVLDQETKMFFGSGARTALPGTRMSKVLDDIKSTAAEIGDLNKELVTQERKNQEAFQTYTRQRAVEQKKQEVAERLQVEEAHLGVLAQLRRTREEGVKASGRAELQARVEVHGFIAAAEREALLRGEAERANDLDRRETINAASIKKRKLQEQNISAASIQKMLGDDYALMQARVKNRSDETEAAIRSMRNQLAVSNQLAEGAERQRLGALSLSMEEDHEQAKEQVRGLYLERRNTMERQDLLAREALRGQELTSERAAMMRNADTAAAMLMRNAAARAAAIREEQMAADGVSRNLIDQQLADDARLMEARIANRAAETEAAIASMEQQRQANNRLMLAQTIQAAATLGQASASMVAMPVVNALTDTMRELGDVNRENYKDFLLFSDEMPALIAKKTQAILAGIAAEAAGKAIMEAGNAGAMFALGLGYTAIPGMQAQAGPAFASAGTHLAAAAVFGSIAGVSIAGAGALAASRGGGGPIPLTRAEQDATKSMDSGGTRDGARGGSGDMGGPGGGGHTYLTYIYEAGSAPPDNRKRHAEATAASVNEANRSWYTRRIIQGRRAA